MPVQITLKMSALEFDNLREAVKLGKTYCEMLAQEAQDRSLSDATTNRHLLAAEVCNRLLVETLI